MRRPILGANSGRGAGSMLFCWSQGSSWRGRVFRPHAVPSPVRPKHEGVVSVRLFIGNLPYSATEPDLREHLSSVGAPAQIVLPTDRETGRPRGFAFVDYADRAVAEEAIRRFNQQPFKGRPLAVSEARPREDRPPALDQADSAVPVPAVHRRAVQQSAAWRLRSAAERRRRRAGDRAAATSDRTRRRRTSANRRARTRIAARAVRSRSARSGVSTTPTRTGAPKMIPKRPSRQLRHQREGGRDGGQRDLAEWTPTSGSSVSSTSPSAASALIVAALDDGWRRRRRRHHQRLGGSDEAALAIPILSIVGAFLVAFLFAFSAPCNRDGHWPARTSSPGRVCSVSSCRRLRCWASRG